MPEGPECRIVRDEISPLIIGKKITNIESSLIINEDSILNSTIMEVGGKGKLVWLKFDNGLYLMITFGMTGKFMISKPKRYLSATFDFDDGSSLYYDDKRKFGTMIIGDDSYHKCRTSKIGPDLYSDDFTPTYVISKISRMKPTKPISKLLMDQGVFAGVGNYIKSEIIYAARINLFVRDELSGDLREAQIKDLTKFNIAHMVIAAKHIALDSYKYGGVSLSDYLHMDGGKGEYLSQCKVYHKDIDRDGKTINKVTTEDGRVSYYIDI